MKKIMIKDLIEMIAQMEDHEEDITLEEIKTIMEDFGEDNGEDNGGNKNEKN